MVDMLLDSLIATVCMLISNLIHALWIIIDSEEVLGGQSDFLQDCMEKLSPRQLAVKQLKEKFLKALQENNAEEVLQILNTGKLDIDTVLEVEDPSMLLASYKQGK